MGESASSKKRRWTEGGEPRREAGGGQHQPVPQERTEECLGDSSLDSSLEGEYRFDKGVEAVTTP